MGTPSYLAPEQTGGRNSEIGPATDLYAFGAILYEMLTGRPPFRAATTLDTIMQVVNDEPVPPRQLQSKIPRNLETICLLCLRKEPSRRYASAEALAEDLARFQAGEPIRARPVGRWERAIKWARRRPAVAALAGALAAVAAIGLTLVTWQWREAVTARWTADQRRVQADDASEDAQRSRSEADRQKYLALEQAAIATRQESAARRTSYTAHINLAQRAWNENHLSRVIALLDQDRPGHGETDLRSFEMVLPVASLPSGKAQLNSSARPGQDDRLFARRQITGLCGRRRHGEIFGSRIGRRTWRAQSVYPRSAAPWPITRTARRWRR